MCSCICIEKDQSKVEQVFGGQSSLEVIKKAQDSGIVVGLHHYILWKGRQCKSSDKDTGTKPLWCSPGCEIHPLTWVTDVAEMYYCEAKMPFSNTS
jgi:hypothetical protein